MSKRAEQRASEEYPRTNQVQFYHREGFVLGYEQAEKDFAELLKERIKTYEDIYNENRQFGNDNESTSEVLEELKMLLKEIKND